MPSAGTSCPAIAGRKAGRWCITCIFISRPVGGDPDRPAQWTTPAAARPSPRFDAFDHAARLSPSRMLPLKDNLVARSAPIMTVSIVTLNVLVFLYQTSLKLGISLEVDNPPHALETAHAFVLEFGLIPCRLMDLCAYPSDQPTPVFTIFSSMFLHGG